MITQQIQQDVDLWEAWIEYDQFDPNHFGTLYILGEILIDTKSKPMIIKCSHDADSHLMLQVPARPLGRSRTKEVLYTEPIKNINQYGSISIYAGTELLAQFDEIEVLI